MSTRVSGTPSGRARKTGRDRCGPAPTGSDPTSLLLRDCGGSIEGRASRSFGLAMLTCLLWLVGLAACSDGGDDGSTPTQAPTSMAAPTSSAGSVSPDLSGAGGSDGVTTTWVDAAGDAGRRAPFGAVTVFAASSLTDVFARIGDMLGERYRGFDIEFNFAGSSALREQIDAGAPADVIVSANSDIVEQLREAGDLASEPQVFARNSLTLVVPSGNPGDIDALADLERPEVLVGVCAAGVPCGDLARNYFAQQNIDPTVVTEEPDVRSLLAKITAQELDAGFVYKTDALAAGNDVEVIDVPGIAAMTTEYSAAVVAEASNPNGGQAFVSLLSDRDVQSELRRQGFDLP